MELITVGTGSTGNCYLLKRDNGHFIALDCGCPWKQVLVGCGFLPSMIDFALVTHSHKDHSGYIRDFEKSGIDVYDCGLMDAISDYFCNHAPIVQWRLGTSLWPNMEGGVCAVSWWEDDNLNMIMFDYKV